MGSKFELASESIVTMLPPFLERNGLAEIEAADFASPPA